MAKINIDGMFFQGESFEIRNGKIYIDGELVYSFPDNNENNMIKLEGNGTLYCDKIVLIDGNFTGSIVANEVVVNGEHNGEVNTNKLIHNK